MFSRHKLFFSIKIVIIFFFLYTNVNAFTKRCYVCKSRGPLGDCKDPFFFNSTSNKLTTDIQERPCPSGWCAKLTQLKESDALLSTERFCLQRPPSDNEERCSETILGEHGRTQMFMCFCKGDFCNKSNNIKSSFLNLVIFIVLSLFFKKSF